MKTTLFALAPLLLTTGCVDPKPDDVSVGEIEQDVSGTQLNGWQCTTSRCAFSLGSATNRTCFLAGIGGNLQSVLSYNTVGVNIWQPTPSTYELLIDNPELHAISANTVCISGAANRQFYHWEPGFPDFWLGNGATQRCFLTGIYNVKGFTHTTDYLRVLKGNKNNGWFLKGSVQAPGWSDVHAVCLDVPTLAGNGDYSWAQGAGHVLLGLASNPQPPGGVACGLTGLAGIFTTDSFTDGVLIDYSTAASQWQWNLTNYKTGYAECVR